MVTEDDMPSSVTSPLELRDEFAYDQPGAGFTEPREPRDLEAGEARVLRMAERVYDESRA